MLGMTIIKLLKNIKDVTKTDNISKFKLKQHEIMRKNKISIL